MRLLKLVLVISPSGNDKAASPGSSAVLPLSVTQLRAPRRREENKSQTLPPLSRLRFFACSSFFTCYLSYVVVWYHSPPADNMKSPIYLFSTSFLYIALDICLYAASGHATTATLTDAPGYESQRPCAKSCYAMDFYDGPARLAYQIDCAYQSAVENECICRSDMQTNAVSYLKDCVSSDCEKGHDVTVALDLYNDYCTGAGFTAETQTPSTTSSSGTPDPPPTVTVTVVETVFLGAAARLQIPLRHQLQALPVLAGLLV